MNTRIFTVLTGLLSLLVIGNAAGCTQSGTVEVTFDQLLSNPGKYNNKNITVEGYYFHGFEIIVLTDSLKESGFAPGHLIPGGGMIWISGGISKEIYDQLNQQQKMGPVERYGKVRITGKFEYGGKYGHVGAYDKQITPVETVILY